MVGEGLKRAAAAVLAAVGVYVVISLSYNEFNPVEWNEINKERDVVRKDNKEKRKHLEDLERRLLEKAEMHDGEVGLSFADQANLARQLGYEGVMKQGSDFGLYVSEGSLGEPRLMLMVGGSASFSVDEKVALAYLGGK